MNKKELKAFVHGAACGAGLTMQLDHPKGKHGFNGLISNMGAEEFGYFIQTLKNRFTGDYEVFEPNNLNEFDCIPSATDYIWSHRSTLDPWNQTTPEVSA